MCVRLYPDFVVATELNNIISQFASMSFEDDNISMLDYIFLSPEACTNLQERYKKIGLGSVILGYGDQSWAAEDYRNFFESHPDIFSRDETDEKFYKVDCSSFYNGEDVDNIEKIRLSAKEFCCNLLTLDSYNNRLLSAVGLV